MVSRRQTSTAPRAVAPPTPGATRLEVILLASGMRRGRRDVSGDFAARVIPLCRTRGHILSCCPMTLGRTTHDAHEDRLGRPTVPESRRRRLVTHGGVLRTRVSVHSRGVADMSWVR